MLVALAAVLGACMGSLAMLCAARWPADESVIAPGSRCDVCGVPLHWYEKLPVVGYVLVLGRCRACGAAVSIIHPLGEAGAAVIWGAMAMRWGAEPETLRSAIFFTILLGIALADARSYIIPDQFSVGGAVLGAALALLPDGPTVAQAAAGAVVGFGLLWAVAGVARLLMGRDALGGGDIKMMAMVGAFAGPSGVLVTLFAGSVLGAVVFGPVSLRTGRLVPFGVFLALGAALDHLWGAAIVAWYLGLVG